MKRTVRIFAVCLLLVFSTICTYAKNTSDFILTISQNEFQMALDYANSLEAKLSLKNALTSEYRLLVDEYNSVKDFRDSFIEHKKYLSTLPINELEAFGYSSKQIEILKNDDYSDTALLLSSAVVTDKIRIKNSATYYSNDLLYTTVRADWNWSGLPNFQEYDQYGIGLKGDRIFLASSYQLTAVYTRPLEVGTFMVNSGTVLMNQDSGIRYKFPMKKNNLDPYNLSAYYYALSGFVVYSARADYTGYGSEPKLFYAIGAYAHRQLVGTAVLTYNPWPTVTFTAGFATVLTGETPKCTYDKSSGTAVYTASSWTSGSYSGNCSY